MLTYVVGLGDGKGRATRPPQGCNPDPGGSPREARDPRGATATATAPTAPVPLHLPTSGRSLGGPVTAEGCRGPQRTHCYSIIPNRKKFHFFSLFSFSFSSFFLSLSLYVVSLNGFICAFHDYQASIVIGNYVLFVSNLQLLYRVRFVAYRRLR